MPNLMMTSIVSEESLARDPHTDRYTHTHTDFDLVYLKLLKTLKTMTPRQCFPQVNLIIFPVTLSPFFRVK